MKSFLTSTNNYWQIRLNAITAQVQFVLKLIASIRAQSDCMRRHPDRDWGTTPEIEESTIPSFQRDLCALRAARLAARSALQQLRMAA